MQSRILAAVVVTTLALASSGCDTKPNAAADSTAAATAAAMSADSAMKAAPPAAPALTDANIVFILDGAHVADSTRGVLASSKGTSKDVRDFGKMMAGEHHAMRKAGQELATKLGVTPMAPSGDMSEMDAKTELDKLTADAKGKTWDQAYIDYEVTYHQAVLATATMALGVAQSQELKDLITKAAPIVQKHLDRALEIQKKQLM